ncbi:transcription/translation regulatory transformer protein RfaH [Aliidiomarina sanyensis]|uniref:Transcription/translation regulatory transformer protein RfaH n=1 Tax=Aliidiomarina sanyensis TaxID=1249555 RepID=A0A432WGF7_9GAMM|nr:transcription/translation regulatory transformer protein RfaH [Aliidiomarina sanyensis]RUO32892.1 transcription/translation regulatory transformer protein RfaH [Aliidiomarina sanyensis]
MPAWYVLHCKARQEERAIANLENQGFRALCPMFTQQKRVAGKRKLVREALFPNYVFIEAEPEQMNLNALRSTRGVRGVVRFGGNLAKVPTAVIAKIRQTAEESAQNDVIPEFAAGSSVTIISGAFAGLQAVYQMPKGEDRCIVLLEMLGKQQQLEIEAQSLTKP